MTRAELARLLDHSVLKPEATRVEVLEGARELDMVIQLGRLKDGDTDAVANRLGTSASAALLGALPSGKIE